MGRKKRKRTFNEAVEDIIEQSQGIPGHEIFGFFKGAARTYPDLSQADRDSLFIIAMRLSAAITPPERRDVTVNVNNVQNANSSATASPHITQTANPTNNLTVSQSAATPTVQGNESNGELSGPGGANGIDGQTQFLRKETFLIDFPQRIREAEASTKPLSLIMFDIDKFKAVNDTFGHPRGDAVLEDVSRCVTSVVEGKGVTYRYGGEEFAILLANYDAPETLALAERLRAALNAQQSGGLAITASQGVACYPLHATTAEDLLARADAALYAAKHAGRNCVRMHDQATNNDPPVTPPLLLAGGSEDQAAMP